MSVCDQEMCDNWTGFGCICEVLQLREDTDDDYTEDDYSFGQTEDNWR